MKRVSLAMIAALVGNFPAFAESVMINASISHEFLAVKATMFEASLSGVTKIEVDKKKAERASTFMIHCDDQGDHYVMLEVPEAYDPWASGDDNIRGSANIRSYGPPIIEIPNSAFSSMRVGKDRIFYITIGPKISEIVRNWYSSGTVRISVAGAKSLPDLNFMVSGPMSFSETQEKFGKAVALCRTLAR